MNAKKAKALRSAARSVAQANDFPRETVYLIHRKTGVIRLGRCEKGLRRHLKKQIRRGLIKFNPAGGLVLRPVPESEVPAEVKAAA
jgi:hypothetical protein